MAGTSVCNFRAKHSPFPAPGSRSAETGFALNSFAITKPIAFTLKDVRASDEITAGCFTLTPRLSASFYDFPDLPSQNWQDLQAGLTLHYDNGAPLSYVAALRAGRSTGADVSQGAGNYAALAGLQDEADELWTISVLAGGAWRAPRVGQGLTAPVMEARLDWAPDPGWMRCISTSPGRSTILTG